MNDSNNKYSEERVEPQKVCYFKINYNFEELVSVVCIYLFTFCKCQSVGSVTDS